MDKTTRLLAAYLDDKRPSAKKRRWIRRRIQAQAAVPDPGLVLAQTDAIYQEVFRAQRKYLKKLQKQLQVSA